MDNLWILSEERPREDVILFILEKLAKDYGIPFFIPSITVIPVMVKERFLFTYKVLGPYSPKIKDILIRIIRGKSSFVDYLVFLKKGCPLPHKDTPIYAIEETKTTSFDSRNTSVFQRASKFVYLDTFYPSNKPKKIMLYHYDRPDKKKKAATFYFGIKLLKTLGVEVSFLNIPNDELELIQRIRPFTSIEELMEEKNRLSRSGPKHNIPLHIVKKDSKIQISAKLDKGTNKYKGKISHDPNIGAVAALSACLRKLGWSMNKDIVIINHGILTIPQEANNKFIRIANAFRIKLEGIELPKIKRKELYWEYDRNSEKNVTILTHITIEKFYGCGGRVIFENHAGSSLGFFITSNGKKLSVNKNIPKPDIVAVDDQNKEIINIEGEKLRNLKKGIEQLKEKLPDFEKEYIKKHYPRFRVIKSLVAFSDDTKCELFRRIKTILQNVELYDRVKKMESCENINLTNCKDIDLIHLILSRYGELVFNESSCPKMIRISFKNLKNFWQK
jgi:hypothetical protein